MRTFEVSATGAQSVLTSIKDRLHTGQLAGDVVGSSFRIRVVTRFKTVLVVEARGQVEQGMEGVIVRGTFNAAGLWAPLGVTAVWFLLGRPWIGAAFALAFFGLGVRHYRSQCRTLLEVVNTVAREAS